ncbi:MAG TPA: hypothetical protein VN516_07740, partial [Candidatus Baltobacteraceae bacterium]|nr:hypothetical protein [Candidatus Baltobacteraceae bacterium]
MFDTNKMATGVSAADLLAGRHFIARLNAADANTNDYDRTTFYRLLSQLSTDSDPESDKMNLNYDNLDAAGNVVPTAETNFIAWTPIRFFTNAADRILRDYTARWATIYNTNEFGYVTNGISTNFVRTFSVTNSFGITAIPVWVSNRFVYTPAVQRLLQLAANIYDSTTTNFYPSIFRPTFDVAFDGTYSNVFITGYVEQTNPIVQPSTNIVLNPDLVPPIESWEIPLGQNILTNVYGVPWIVGAKKGFPNFNEFSVQSAFQITRKLQVIRDTNAPTQPDIIQTNQMYLMNITNQYGIECWNSYRTMYLGPNNISGPIDFVVRCSSTVHIPTNLNNTLYANNTPNGFYFTTNFSFSISTPQWPGWNGAIKTPHNSFIIPFNASVLTLTNAVYVYNGGGPAFFANIFTNPVNYYDVGIQPMPSMTMLTTNRLQFAIIDYSKSTSEGRIVDYVQLGGLDSTRDLTAEIKANDVYHFFDTNYDTSSG